MHFVGTTCTLDEGPMHGCVKLGCTLNLASETVRHEFQTPLPTGLGMWAQQLGTTLSEPAVA